MIEREVLIIGSGLAALATAARLSELGRKDIALYGQARGGTPFIAAINFVLPDNPYGDSPERYAEDMIEAGYGIGDRTLVEAMCRATVRGFELMERWGVEFAREPGGSLKRRHASGSTYPRSLCRTTDLVGVEMLRKLERGLAERGVESRLGRECLGLLVEGGRVRGAVFRDGEGRREKVLADRVVAAWGGVGNLFGSSTYPADIKGTTIAAAFESGAKLVDMEFLEYEPMVVISPRGAAGEPCPTAMLGEGAHLLNGRGERFMLGVRPQGEAGSPKTLINKEIWKQVAAGSGSPGGGAWVDMRHIPAATLQAYPWFYRRLKDNGVDPCEELVEVGPMAHSYSGGIKVDGGYESSVSGLYAVGEAAGGIHGACRLAGNAASQAVLSGLLCAEALGEARAAPARGGVPDFEYPEDEALRARRVPEIRSLAARALGVYRNGPDLAAARDRLRSLLDEGELAGDGEARQVAISVLVMVTAALERRESRGTHLRTDYPERSADFGRGIVLWKEPGEDARGALRIACEP